MELNKILDALAEKQDLKENKGVILTAFSKDGKLILEKGIVFSDNSLEENIKKLYEKYLKKEKNIEDLLVDVIDNIQEVKKTAEMKKIDTNSSGVFIGDPDGNGTFFLPETSGINGISDIIKVAKKKLNLTSNIVYVYKFDIARLVL